MEIPKMTREIFFHNCACIFGYMFSYEVEQVCPLDTYYRDNISEFRNQKGGKIIESLTELVIWSTSDKISPGNQISKSNFLILKPINRYLAVKTQGTMHLDV